MDLHPFGIPKVTILSTFEIDRCSFKNMKEASEKQGDNKGSRLLKNMNTRIKVWNDLDLRGLSGLEYL